MNELYKYFDDVDKYGGMFIKITTGNKSKKEIWNENEETEVVNSNGGIGNRNTGAISIWLSAYGNGRRCWRAKHYMLGI